MHVRILSKQLILRPLEAFAEAKHEESHRKVMIETHNSSNDSEATIFVIREEQ